MQRIDNIAYAIPYWYNYILCEMGFVSLDTENRNLCRLDSPSYILVLCLQCYNEKRCFIHHVSSHFHTREFRSLGVKSTHALKESNIV